MLICVIILYEQSQGFTPAPEKQKIKNQWVGLKLLKYNLNLRRKHAKTIHQRTRPLHGLQRHKNPEQGVV